MYPVSARFHELSVGDAPKTRCRIYFIQDTVDCTDDAAVVADGELLCAEGDTDSNGVIALDEGLSITNYFNPDENLEIGKTVSSQLSFVVLNDGGVFDNFQFGRCKVFIDVYDSENSEWLACPIGVFIIDTPKRRRVQRISATGFDQMQKLSGIADGWWGSIDWSNGVTISSVIQMLAANLGISLSSTALTNLVNASVSFTSPPFSSIQMTYREVLEKLAEATCTNALFDRNGALDFRWFSAAEISDQPVTINASTASTNCLSIDISEYEFPQISGLQVKVTESDIGTSIGDSDNLYTILGNGLLGGATESEVANKATPIFNRLASLGAFSPVQTRLVADWSIEAGDIINITFRNTTYALPIFQQTLTWRGGYVTSDLFSSGDSSTPVTNVSRREEYRSNAMMHEFSITLDELRSLIQDVSGNYSLIQQTINSIEQTVSGQGISISNILDTNGAIWTAIRTNASNLGDIENSLNAEITERKSYIRFIPTEPAIVLGVEQDNEIKLKMVNNRIWFFSGSDDSTDLSNAFAYFNSDEAFSERFVAKERVQIGMVDDPPLWMWHKLTSGDLVLDFINV